MMSPEGEPANPWKVSVPLAHLGPDSSSCGSVRSPNSWTKVSITCEALSLCLNGQGTDERQTAPCKVSEILDLTL